ncbi:GTP 3',8-cyclase MoaA [Tessaracoccus sp. MC1865]|uniref:GTP 3',8-cyclase MoaA n=1 Tax=Tessaracoccus sp. MC1865 TaxID=2760310 RepID=UPI00160107FE|nr:GTP 3',8-cyclase MoaA [Tessaracoccus sp. MC1865]MBB1483891.1 GTP 3',8-cyclase MoaA [Tessaracoccus sp. MC1865]QTO36944.1 GTP 3',8-cyclase MoaA [Tessaracoccus sp. MC1865]
MLVDGYGRTARDLRVSLTDRCNLRCTYCMPAEGLLWQPVEETLTDDEVSRVIKVAVERLGVTRIRFTGGEPLLRAGLERIVAVAATLTPRPELALTTNGLGLDKRVDGLVSAGLDRVNISLDSLDRERYAQLARRDRLPDVLAGIEAAQRAGLEPVKINAVIMRGANEPDIVPLAQFCLERGYQLRFIEQMPLGPKGEWDRDAMVTAAQILGALEEQFDLSPAEEPRGAAPAQLWRVAADDAQPGGLVGVIASVTHPFCGDCDRTRITSDGHVRTCLFSRTETDLRAILRDGGSDDDLVAAWTGAHRTKPKAHGIDEVDFVQPDRTMSAIGG